MFEFWGRHTLCNMEGIYAVDLNNSDFLIRLLQDAISASKATLVEIVCHKFSPEGASIIAILKESHVALHIYPEHCALFLDAFTCGRTSDPEKIVLMFVECLSPKTFAIETITRCSPVLKKDIFKHNIG